MLLIQHSTDAGGLITEHNAVSLSIEIYDLIYFHVILKWDMLHNNNLI